MAVLIENYRGVEILFDPECEKFTFSFDDAKYGEKQSYAACKKAINDYVNDEANFKPFMIMHKESYTTLQVVGRYKTGSYVVIKDGKKEQLGGYDQKAYLIHTPADDQTVANLVALEAEWSRYYEDYRERRKAFREQFTGKPLKELQTV